jgi:hypothetical protein
MFKLNLLKFRTSRAIKKNRTQRGSIAWKKAKSVGIIFSVVDRQKHDDIKEFIRQLESDGKKVNVLEFLPHKKENFEFLFDFFTVDELSFWGKITSARALQFMTVPFDYLFYVDQEPNPLVLNLMAESNAVCRIGKFTEKESDFYELMIEHTGTIKGLIDNMYKYTRMLR